MKSVGEPDGTVSVLVGRFQTQLPALPTMVVVAEYTAEGKAAEEACSANS